MSKKSTIEVFDRFLRKKSRRIKPRLNSSIFSVSDLTENSNTSEQIFTIFDESYREKPIRKSSNTKNKDSSTITIPKQEAIDIYSVRSKLPSAINGEIKGFDKLLQGLYNLNDDFVTISKENKSLKFTNKEQKIIGKLIFKASDLPK